MGFESDRQSQGVGPVREGFLMDGWVIAAGSFGQRYRNGREGRGLAVLSTCYVAGALCL